MLFNSAIFAVFFVVVFSLYWLLRRSHRAQNVLLLGASYFFYGWWDVRFLVLIIISTVLDYSCAWSMQKGRMSLAQRLRASAYLIVAALVFLGVNFRAFDMGIVGRRPTVVADWGHLLTTTPMYWWIILGVTLAVIAFNAIYPALMHLREAHRRRLFLVLSVATNLTILGFFKYFNFFVDTFETALASTFGITTGGWTLHIILPVGISFYIFQTMSYTIDAYRGKVEASRSLIEVATYVSFFPQLVAGPIERASHLLPQFRRPRRVDRADFRHGLWLIVWGLFQKMVVADNMARLVDTTFAPFTAAGPTPAVPEDGLRLLVVIYAFAIQIYCDFAGYTDIARGTARLLGFEIMLNFNLPYLAKDPSDFWRRWHISLSTWLRDYLYIPLGGNRRGTLQTYRNLMLTMLLGGLWHGAAWTFVLWGGFHGFILVVYRGLSASKERWALTWKEIGRRVGFLRTRVATEPESAEPLEVAPVPSKQKEKWASIWRPINNGGRFFRTAALRDPQSGQPLESADRVAEWEDRNIYLNSGMTIVRMLVMFHLVCLGWLLFRAQNLATVGIFLQSILFHPHWSPGAADALRRLVFYGWFLVAFDLLRGWKGTLTPFENWPWFARLNIWVFVIMSLLALGARAGHEFIYFAF